MSNVISLDGKPFTQKTDELIDLTEIEAINLAIKFCKANISGGLSEDDVNIIHNLSKTSNTRLSRWMCTVSCMLSADISIGLIKRIAYRKAEQMKIEQEEYEAEHNLE